MALLSSRGFTRVSSDVFSRHPDCQRQAYCQVAIHHWWVGPLCNFQMVARVKYDVIDRIIDGYEASTDQGHATICVSAFNVCADLPDQFVCRDCSEVTRAFEQIVQCLDGACSEFFDQLSSVDRLVSVLTSPTWADRLPVSSLTRCLLLACGLTIVHGDRRGIDLIDCSAKEHEFRKFKPQYDLRRVRQSLESYIAELG